MVLCAYSLGLGNGGMAPREALWRYTGAIPCHDRQRRQHADAPADRDHQGVEVNVICGFPSYLRHMALIARDEMGIDPHSLGIRLIGTHLGMEERKADRRARGARPLTTCTARTRADWSRRMQAPDRHARAGRRVRSWRSPIRESGRILPDGEKGMRLHHDALQ